VSAVPATSVHLGSVPLRLTPTREMPRKLLLSWYAHELVAMVYAPSSVRRVKLADAIAYHELCVLRAADENGQHSLSLGQASFPLTPGEARIVRATFGPLGLQEGPAI